MTITDWLRLAVLFIGIVAMVLSFLNGKRPRVLLLVGVAALVVQYALAQLERIERRHGQERLDARLQKIERSVGSLTLIATRIPDRPASRSGPLVLAADVMEARADIDAVRGSVGLTPFAWTDAALVPGSTPVRAAHVAELRTALNQAYQAAGRTPPAYTDPSVTSGTRMKAIHLYELRATVRAFPPLGVPAAPTGLTVQ
jgi:hypothetical protein